MTDDHSKMTIDEETAEALPPLPWNVLWVGGYCYLVAADGSKFGTLYGRQAQREAVAEAMIMAFGKKP